MAHSLQSTFTHTLRRPAVRQAAGRGFTLLELLIVLVLIGVASATIMAGMRSSDEVQLHKQAEQLVAAIEVGRAQSRARGLAAELAVHEGGFLIKDPHVAIDESKITPWLEPGMTASGHVPLLLGPEPILPPQTLQLHLGEFSVRISSQGLAPFVVEEGL